MIVVTVGTQLPFDRLIRMMDEIAPDLDMPVFAQTGVGTYEPKNIRWQKSIGPVEFDAIVRDAKVIVAHAGIGTVLKAYKHVKPLILVSRRAALGEHRNDHQLATISQLRSRVGIYEAETVDDLRAHLTSDLAPAVMTSDVEVRRARLIDFVRANLAS